VSPWLRTNQRVERRAGPARSRKEDKAEGIGITCGGFSLLIAPVWDLIILQWARSGANICELRDSVSARKAEWPRIVELAWSIWAVNHGALRSVHQYTNEFLTNHRMLLAWYAMSFAVLQSVGGTADSLGNAVEIIGVEHC
jgi:hypothetical protein